MKNVVDQYLTICIWCRRHFNSCLCLGQTSLNLRLGCFFVYCTICNVCISIVSNFLDIVFLHIHNTSHSCSFYRISHSYKMHPSFFFVSSEIDLNCLFDSLSHLCFATIFRAIIFTRFSPDIEENWKWTSLVSPDVYNFS